ncbi:hypothetical protein [Rhodococcus qingshengii]|uniref:hypothetical protein n=1 Tax=Rhodococcus qingshengii TaxID=334542 RepID=UPI0018D32EC2|nr:hypothetical protein [Rhodococcus qingshengii]
MTDKHSQTDDAVTVGSRVDVTARTSGDNATEKQPGVVHRWAIALDDGRLVFANNEDLL